MSERNDSQIPSETYYVLNAHEGALSHLSWSADGEWLVSCSADKRALIWDFGAVLMTSPPLSVRDGGNIHSPIPILCDVLHFEAVTMAALSPNKRYLVTMTQSQPTLDDLKHEAGDRHHVGPKREEQKSADTVSSSATPQFAEWDEESDHSYFEEESVGKRSPSESGGGGRNEEMLQMETGRGCNVYVWRLKRTLRHDGRHDAASR